MTDPDLRSLIRDIPDFPAAGIMFKDITPLLLDHDGGALRRRASWRTGRARGEVDYVVAAEARGFILGAALALELDAGFVPARKPGKLPADTISAEYILEYGVDALEMHADALAHGARVLIHDDLLATGGTARALAELVEELGGSVVGMAFLVELGFLEGRRRLEGFDVCALIALRRLSPSGRPPLAHGRRAASTTSGRSSAIPYHLPRWWPRTQRVEGVSSDGWTSVLVTDKGRSVRADYRVELTKSGERRRWSQEVAGTPFEKLFREVVYEIALSPALGGHRGRPRRCTSSRSAGRASAA